MLRQNDTVIVVVDIQGKLAQMMTDKTEVYKNAKIMISGAQILELPIILTEQYPEGLGFTIPEIAELLQGIEPITKTSFSCCGEDRFNSALETLGRKQVVLIGIETHVCVWQTAYDLLAAGYEVFVVADAVSSRKAANKNIGLEKMRDAGAVLTCTETALFELMKKSGGEKFKQISRLVR